MNHIFKFSILITILISISCNKEFNSFIGKYESKEYSKIKLMWMRLNNTFVSIGDTIEIKEDTTFYYQTCGNIITGNWRLKKDTLYLFSESNRWRNDSLHLNGFEGRHPTISDKPMKFKIGNKEITETTKFEKNGKLRTFVNKLEQKESR